MRRIAAGAFAFLLLLLAGCGGSSQPPTRQSQPSPRPSRVIFRGPLPGTPAVGDILTTSSGRWSGSPTGFTYLWQDCDASGGSCTTAGGSPTNTTRYAIVAADTGFTIRVKVTASYAGHPDSSVQSPPTAIVGGGGAAPVNTVVPTMSGTPRVGQVLTASTNGTWSNSPTSFTYQWQDCDALEQNCSNITGATSSSYTLASSDSSSSTRVFVTAHNAAGTGNASSGATDTVTSSVVPAPSYRGDISTGDLSQYSDCADANADPLTDGKFADYAIDSWSGAIGTHGCGAGLGVPPLVRDIHAPYGYGVRFHVSSTSYGNGGEGFITGNTIDWPTTPPSTTGKTQGYQGLDEWYRDMVYFPTGFHPDTNSDWNTFLEFHVFPNFNGPYESFHLTVETGNTDGGPSGGKRLSASILGGGTPAIPITGTYSTDSALSTWHSTWEAGPTLQTDHWYDIVLHIHWDYRTVANGGSGAITEYIDGAKQFSYTGPDLWYATNDGSGSAGTSQTYLMHDYYTNTTNPGPNNVYHAATYVGATEAAVGENFTP